MNLLKKKRQKDSKSILDLLLNSRDQETGDKKLTNEEIIADIFIFLVAGHETTAHTLVFSIHLLAMHPEVQEELHQHVIATIGNSDPTYEDLQKLDFPLKIFKETLRLFPSVPLIPKMCTTTTKIGDHTFYPKTLVDINVFRIHRDPKYWKDPEKFDPHRWDENSDQLGPITPHCFLPFSHGKRNCLGRKFAEIEGTLFLTMLAQNYRVEYAPGSSILKEEELCNFVTLTPIKPVMIVLKKR